jgi:predicted MPP superfamily phosphohydrolase
LGDKQLYTSSGGGHWFAFRLACPSEAALVVLERGEPGDDSKLG